MNLIQWISVKKHLNVLIEQGDIKNLMKLLSSDEIVNDPFVVNYFSNKFHKKMKSPTILVWLFIFLLKMI